MVLTTEVSALNAGLAIVTRALGARSAKQILECVLLQAKGDTLYLTCSDGNLMIRYSLSAQITEEGGVALPGRLFSEMCRKMPDGEIKIQKLENNTVRVSCQRSKMSLMGIAAAEYPLPEELREGVRLSFAQPTLRETDGVWLEADRAVLRPLLKSRAENSVWKRELIEVCRRQLKQHAPGGALANVVEPIYNQCRDLDPNRKIFWDLFRWSDLKDQICAYQKEKGGEPEC